MSAIKRYTALFLIPALVFALAGCGSSSGNTEQSESSAANVNTENSDGDNSASDDMNATSPAQESSE